MADRGDSGGGGGDLSSSSATALPADRRRAMTSSKRGHQHHPKFLGNRPPASAVEVISALRAANSRGCSAELPLLIDRLNNNSRNKEGGLDNVKTNDPSLSTTVDDPYRISQTDIKSDVKVAVDRGVGGDGSSSANAQVEQKNVSNLLIELPQTKAATQTTTTINTIADESGARATKAIRSMMDDDKGGDGDSKRSDPVLLQQRRKGDEDDSLLTHCDTERPSTSTTNLVSRGNECGEEDNRLEHTVHTDVEMIEEDEDSLNNNIISSNSDHLRRRRKSNKTSVLTERNANKSSSTAGSKRRSAGSSAGGPTVDVDEDATGTAVEPKRKSPSSSSTSKKEKGTKDKKKTSRSTRTTGNSNNTKAASDGAMDRSVSTDMTSSQESRSEDTENDPEAAEWLKLRCTSERTEVVAEREYRRQNRRCADYPGLAFGRSIFSSDTMMKFNIIRNELHNIMKTQLKRVRVVYRNR